MHEESSYCFRWEDILILLLGPIALSSRGWTFLGVDVCHLNEKGLALSAHTYVGPPISKRLRGVPIHFLIMVPSEGHALYLLDVKSVTQ